MNTKYTIYLHYSSATYQFLPYLLSKLIGHIIRQLRYILQLELLPYFSSDLYTGKRLF